MQGAYSSDLLSSDIYIMAYDGVSMEILLALFIYSTCPYRLSTRVDDERVRAVLNGGHLGFFRVLEFTWTLSLF